MTAQDALNPQQHKDFVYSRNTDDPASGTMYDEYKLIQRTTSKGEMFDPVTHHEVGKLEVTRHPGRPEKIGKGAAEAGVAYDEDWFTDSRTATKVGGASDQPYSGINPSSDMTQGRLFEYRAPTAPSHNVSYLGGTEKHRAQNMVMLGIAENTARAAGTTLNPSDDLSKHSARLVGHLKGKGAVSEDASTRVTNKIQFHHGYNIGANPFRYGTEQIPQHEVEAGRQTMRQVVRGDQRREIPGQQKMDF
jgi:hypothetical protein